MERLKKKAGKYESFVNLPPQRPKSIVQKYRERVRLASASRELSMDVVMGRDTAATTTAKRTYSSFDQKYPALRSKIDKTIKENQNELNI